MWVYLGWMLSVFVGGFLFGAGFVYARHRAQIREAGRIMCDAIRTQKAAEKVLAVHKATHDMMMAMRRPPRVFDTEEDDDGSDLMDG